MVGIVEGIVPVDHANQSIAGSAAFLPSFVLAAFVEYVERYMLEQLLPKDMFQTVVRAKETNTIGGGSFNVGKDGMPESSWEEAFEKQVEALKKKYSKEEMDAILWNVKVCYVMTHGTLENCCILNTDFWFGYTSLLI